MEIPVLIEESNGELWGRIEGIGDFMPLVVGNTKVEVATALKELINDYKIHEGKEDKEWLAIKVENAVFTFAYDVQQLDLN